MNNLQERFNKTIEKVLTKSLEQKTVGSLSALSSETIDLTEEVVTRDIAATLIELRQMLDEQNVRINRLEDGFLAIRRRVQKADSLEGLKRFVAEQLDGMEKATVRLV